MASVRQLTKPGKDGKRPWVCEYTDAKGKRRRITPKTGLKRDADAVRRKIEAGLERGDHVAKAETATVAQVVEEFLRFQEDRLRDGRIGKGTLRLFSMEARNSWLPRLGKLLIKDVTPVDIEQFYLGMVREDGLLPSTAKDRVQSFRDVCRFAKRRGYLKAEPVTDALQELRGVTSEPIRTFKKDEIATLLKLLEEKPSGKWYHCHATLRAVVHLALFCGLRYGEIAGLKIENVKFDTRLLQIRHNLTNFNVLKAPKTRAGVRDVPMPPHVAEMLAEYLREFYLPNDQTLIFRSSFGNRLSGPNFHEHHWRPLLERAGLGPDERGRRLHFHALRHFAASWWIDRKMSLTDTASLLGHAKFDVTLRVYAHPIAGGGARNDLIDGAATALIGPVIYGSVATFEASDATRTRQKLLIA